MSPASLASRYCSCLLALVALAGPVCAAEPLMLKPPTSGDGAAGDFFGVQLYVDSDWLLVGAYGDVLNSDENFTGIQSGSVKSYRLRAGKPEPGQLLQPPQPTENTLFGDEIVRSGEWLAISAPRFTSAGGLEGGGVFLFQLVGENWLYRQTLVPAPAVTEGRFGEGLYIEPGRLWVGSPQRGNGQLAIYGLSGSGATLIRIVSAPAGERGFGHAIAAAPDGRLAVGAPGSNAVLLLDRANPQLPGTRFAGPAGFGRRIASSAVAMVVAAPEDGAGSVHRWIYDGSQWLPQQVLRPAVGAPGDQFGASLSLMGAQLYIGAPGTDRGSDFDVGAVYHAGIDGGPALLPSGTSLAQSPNSVLFGSAIAASAELNRVWVGAPLSPAGNQRSGQVLDFDPGALGAPTTVALRTLDRGEGAQLFRYGQSVDIDGDWAIVGAYLADTDAGADSGAAYLYRRNGSGWELKQTLKPLDATVDQRFGLAVAIEGETAVVGAYWDVIDGRPEQGSAYVFRLQRETWVQQAKLVARDGRDRDFFGASVAISGDRIAVAAPGVDQTFADSGAAYIFLSDQGRWLQEARLVSPDPSSTTVFGQSLALSGDRLVVGAPGQNRDGEADVGEVLVFNRAADRGWGLAQSLQSPVLQSSALFGFGVASHGGRVLVGAPGVDLDSAQFVGAAWLYECTDSCGPAQPLAFPNPQEGDQFGIGVGLNGVYAVVGAHGVDGVGIDSGAAYAYELRGLSLQQRLEAPRGGINATFGRTVQVDDQNQLIIGSPTRAGDNPSEGAASVLTLSNQLFDDGFESQ